MESGVVHTCNPSSQERRQEEYCEFEANLNCTVWASLAYRMRTCLQKNQRMTTLNKKNTLGNESLKSPKFLRFVWIGTKAFVFSKTEQKLEPLVLPTLM